MDIPEPDPPNPSQESGDESSGASRRPWLQILSNYATIVIAMSAVILSVWEGCEMRKHNRLSVLPNLDVIPKQLTLEKGEQVELGGNRETVTERTFYLELSIENTGLGPAVFEKAKLFRVGPDTLIYETEEKGEMLNIYRADSLVRQLRPLFPEMGSFTGPIEQGVMMKAGESYSFLQAVIPASTVPDTLDRYPPGHLQEMISRYSFVVCYCSVYGEDCDQAHIGGAPPKGACRF